MQENLHPSSMSWKKGGARMAQYNVGLPFLKTSFNPVSRQANRKTASTAYVNAVMREMFDERIGRDKDIEHSDTANNEWLIADKEFTEIYENVESGELTTYRYTPDIDDPRALASQQKLVQRDQYTADEYVKSVKKIVDDNNDRLKEHGKRKLRKDCMCCVAGIVKVPIEIVNQPGFDSSKFYRDSLEVLKELCNDEFRCGEINAAVIHRDEYIDKEQNLKSDHLHYNIIPYCWEEGIDGQKFKSLNGKKFLNKTFFTIINKNFPKMMRERGWDVADCIITEDLETKKEQKQHQEQAAGKDSIHYKAQAEREKQKLIDEIEKKDNVIQQLKEDIEHLKKDKENLEKQKEEVAKEVEQQQSTIQIQQQTINQQQSLIQQLHGKYENLVERYNVLVSKVNELIDAIRPLGRLKSILEALRAFAPDFKDKVREIRAEYYLNDDEEEKLDNVLIALDEHDISLDEAIAVAQTIELEGRVNHKETYDKRKEKEHGR